MNHKKFDKECKLAMKKAFSVTNWKQLSWFGKNRKDESILDDKNKNTNKLEQSTE